MRRAAAFSSAEEVAALQQRLWGDQGEGVQLEMAQRGLEKKSSGWHRNATSHQEGSAQPQKNVSSTGAGEEPLARGLGLSAMTGLR